MSSRFFVASSSDSEDEDNVPKTNKVEEEEEENNEENDNVSRSNKGGISSFFADSGRRSNEKRVVLSERQKRWLDLRVSSYNVVDKFEQELDQLSFSDFQSLVKTYAKSQKAISEFGHPKFFIRCVSKIIGFVDQRLLEGKDFRRFKSELNKFIEPFKEDLELCKQNPEEFEEEEEEAGGDDGFYDDFGVIKSDDEKEGPSKWFISSDDEADDTKATKEATDDSSKAARHSEREITTAEAAEARLRAKEQEKIDEATIESELSKASESRQKGRVTITTSRLSNFLLSCQKADLMKRIRLEICYCIIQGPSDLPISLNDWNLVMDNISYLKDEAQSLVSLFERLNKDFWARSVDPVHLFTPDVAKLHSFLPKFLEIMEDFSKQLKTDNAASHCGRLQHLLLEHHYHDKQKDVRDLAFSIIEFTSREGLFDESSSLNIRIRASLFYAINLAIRGYPVSAAKILSYLPDIPNSLPLAYVLCNRAYAEIGISAFLNGHYRLCYDSLYQFYDNLDSSLYNSVNRYLGQNPSLYPPWLTIEPRVLEVYCFVSGMILDLPFLTVAPDSEDRLFVRSSLHKEFMKRSAVPRPEKFSDRLATSIEHCKRGEWQLALSILNTDYEKYFNNSRILTDNIKLISFCSFLLTANLYYDSASISSFERRFEISREDILRAIKSMQNGISPVVGASITFKAKLDEKEEYLIFSEVEKKNPLAAFDLTLKDKSQYLQKQIEKMKI